MTTCTISLNEELADAINDRIKKYKFANRSEYFRYLARKDIFSEEEALAKENERLIASIAKKIAKEDKSKYLTLTEALEQS